MWLQAPRPTRLCFPCHQTYNAKVLHSTRIACAALYVAALYVRHCMCDIACAALHVRHCMCGIACRVACRVACHVTCRVTQRCVSHDSLTSVATAHLRCFQHILLSRMGAYDMGAYDMGAYDMGAYDMGMRGMGMRGPDSLTSVASWSKT